MGILCTAHKAAYYISILLWMTPNSTHLLAEGLPLPFSLSDFNNTKRDLSRGDMVHWWDPHLTKHTLRKQNNLTARNIQLYSYLNVKSIGVWRTYLQQAINQHPLLFLMFACIGYISSLDVGVWMNGSYSCALVWLLDVTRLRMRCESMRCVCACAGAAQRLLMMHMKKRGAKRSIVVCTSLHLTTHKTMLSYLLKVILSYMT